MRPVLSSRRAAAAQLTRRERTAGSKTSCAPLNSSGSSSRSATSCARCATRPTSSACTRASPCSFRSTSTPRGSSAQLTRHSRPQLCLRLRILGRSQAEGGGRAARSTRRDEQRAVGARQRNFGARVDSLRERASRENQDLFAPPRTQKTTYTSLVLLTPPLARPTVRSRSLRLARVEPGRARHLGLEAVRRLDGEQGRRADEDSRDEDDDGDEDRCGRARRKRRAREGQISSGSRGCTARARKREREGRRDAQRMSAGVKKT